MSSRRGAFAAAVALLLSASGCTFLVRSSVGTGNVQSNAPSGPPAISADGRYVAFASTAGNLIPNKGNLGVQDVYVHDNRTGTTSRVSIASNGTPGNADSSDGQGLPPAISADGRFVAFTSGASNLGPGSPSPFGGVYVRDRLLHTTIEASVGLAGAHANGSTDNPSISADGRLVAFQSRATNLVTGPHSPLVDEVYVRDLVAGTTRQVSVGIGGAEPDDVSFLPQISGNGRFVVFNTLATNILPNDTASGEILLTDLQTGTTERIVAAGAGIPQTTLPFHGVLDADAGVVGYTLRTVSSDGTADHAEAFVVDRVTHATERVNVGADPTEPNSISEVVGLDGDGRLVAFTSTATTLLPGPPLSPGNRLYVRDRATGVTSLALGGVAAGAISADGRYVAARTDDRPVPADTNGVADVYTRFALDPRLSSVAPSTPARGTSTNVVVSGVELFPDAVVLGGDGFTVTRTIFLSPTTLVARVVVAPGATPGPRNVVVTEPGTGPGHDAGAFAVCPGCLTIG